MQRGGWGGARGGANAGGIGYKKPTPKPAAPVQVPEITVPGLLYIPDFISEEEERAIIAQIDSSTWSTELKRRVQQYGYRFDYTTHLIGGQLPPLPAFCDPIIAKIASEKLFPYIPDQLIINEYQPGQGIKPHSDERVFDTHIASLSLGSPCVMNFRSRRQPPQQKDLLLQPRSLLVLSGEARYDWTHGIDQNKREVINGVQFDRERRISLTFRRVIQ